jgi:hypothetical protein
LRAEDSTSRRLGEAEAGTAAALSARQVAFLLTSARWEVLRDDVRAYVTEHLGDPVGVATKPKLAQGMSPMCWRSRPRSRCGRPESRVRPRSPARQLVAGLPARAWRRLSAGDGAKGPRVYDWARVALTRPGWPGRRFWLLARWRLTDEELALYACFGPARTALAGWCRWQGFAGRSRSAPRPPSTMLA